MNENHNFRLDRIPFIDLAAQRSRLGPGLDRALAQVFQHGQYIMGPEVGILERELARFCGAPEVITCANGTDALELVLRAKEVGHDQAVLCPSFTFAATAEVVVRCGATPIFVDVLPDSYSVDPASIAFGVRRAVQEGLRPAGLIAVDLFGQAADYEALGSVCAEHGLWLLADAAQSFGAADPAGRRVGSLCAVTTTSFYPAKPLGCYGDGGAVFTLDPELAAILRSLRAHGTQDGPYHHVRVGSNSRLDTLQAAILLEKLKIFPDEIERRNAVALRYSAALADVAAIPGVPQGAVSTWAQYTIKVEAQQRAELAADLNAAGIPTAIHYPCPLHRQPAFAAYPVAGNGLPVSERLAGEVISLPMHPYLDAGTQDRIVAAVRAVLATPSRQPARTSA